MTEPDEQPRYLVNVHVVAGIMACSLLIGTLVAIMFSGIPGLLTWLVIWVCYFGIGWVLNPFQRRMLALMDAAERPGNRYGEDHTYAFLVWPLTIWLTAVYIPLLLVLRRFFRDS
jgi:hypothetical protein